MLNMIVYFNIFAKNFGHQKIEKTLIKKREFLEKWWFNKKKTKKKIISPKNSLENGLPGWFFSGKYFDVWK